MTSQPVSSIFLSSPLPSGTWQTQGLSIPWCCLSTSVSVSLVSFPFHKTSTMSSLTSGRPLTGFGIQLCERPWRSTTSMWSSSESSNISMIRQRYGKSEPCGLVWCADRVEMHQLPHIANQSGIHKVLSLHFHPSYLQSQSATKTKILHQRNLLLHLVKVVFSKPQTMVLL